MVAFDEKLFFFRPSFTLFALVKTTVCALLGIHALGKDPMILFSSPFKMKNNCKGRKQANFSSVKIEVLATRMSEVHNMTWLLQELLTETS